ncbi:hypothetical protein [Dyella subtropica]|uniref:hypothetical protein n=1 Tax=Dyella subtropica TaxID=2992127 RepID=UPI0022568EA1|nr:hypothetical protein [Dyella subtropica]
MPTTKLVELSRHKGQPYQTEQERLDLIAGNRAALLLRATTSDQDASGCSVVSLDRGAHGTEAMFLVGTLIQSGQAVILRDGSSQPESSVVIHDHDGQMAGYRSFEFMDGGVFLSFPTWVS